MVIINIFGIVIRRILRGYMKKNIHKILNFDNFDNFIPFYKDTAYAYEFIKENKNKIQDFKLFLIQFIIDFFETINIVFSTIFRSSPI